MKKGFLLFIAIAQCCFASPAKEMSVDSLYLDLLKKSILDIIYQDQPRTHNDIYPLYADSMIGKLAMDNLEYCLESVIQNNIPGDFIETGVWRGGATIFMRGFLKAKGITDRKVWVADSFNGIPAPSEDYPADKWDFSDAEVLKVSQEQVMKNFAKYNLLDEQVIFLKGWFCDTLPTAQIDEIAILRLDGDLYQSTWEALENLYPKLSVGGFAIIDDYNIGIPCCAQAVEDYRAKHQIKDPMLPVPPYGVFWKKSAGFIQ